MKHILITGGAGFIGAHLVDHILANTDWKIIVLDGLTYAGDVGRLTDSRYYDKDRVRIHWHNLNSLLPEVLIRKIGHVDYIVNMASNSHIDASIDDPVPFVQNNVNVALTMLEYARASKPKVFIQISTDEVYGAAESGQLFPEWTVISPSNPYSASKAAQEAIAIAYWKTYGVPVVITNPMNNFGERQDREKFIPKTLHCIMTGSSMTIHGSPGHIGSRCYMHARNNADAILFLLGLRVNKYGEKPLPDRYNVVGNEIIDNLVMAQKVAEYARRPLKYELIDFHSARPGHDPHYALDGSKLAALGWKAPVPLDDSLKKTIEWTIANEY
jgi:dTDP-glucose 4,6-dehydratase